MDELTAINEELLTDFEQEHGANYFSQDHRAAMLAMPTRELVFKLGEYRQWIRFRGRIVL